ncbi:MAG TPA: hypothetical protein VGO39_13770, partial [Gaiellaceae bacterium]|nr:hypothetical protein [Gaiellaceae bacterium]
MAVALIALACGGAAYLARPAASPVPAAAPSEHFSRQGLLSLPLAAQGPVSASLGAEAAIYRIHDAGTGLVAVNLAQHLR